MLYEICLLRILEQLPNTDQLQQLSRSPTSYVFECTTLVESEVSRATRYFPRQESEFWVEVVMAKQGGIEIRKYRTAEVATGPSPRWRLSVR
jgi:hypothetical protein